MSRVVQNLDPEAFSPQKEKNSLYLQKYKVTTESRTWKKILTFSHVTELLELIYRETSGHSQSVKVTIATSRTQSKMG